jgi:putative copper resistance protein D
VVGLLVIAGAIVLVVLLDGVAQLWTSRYGRLVSIKLGLVVALLSLAAFNKLRLTPRLRTGDSSAILIFRHSIEAEMLLAGSILVITAAFTTITGPGLEE